MSGFDRNWLALREPVDARSRDRALLEGAVEAIENAAKGTVLDIGCGTGSTFRMLAPEVGKDVRWRLFDRDPHLLDEAGRRHGNVLELLQGDLNDIEALPLADVGLVTASALFDLCSEEFVHRFVHRIAEAGIGLYAALNYDGEMRWSKPHPLDEVIAAIFNAHQLSDKGFGVALGPSAWEFLADRLRKNGYTVRTAGSPWIMTAAEADLQRLFLAGVMRAVFEYGELDEEEIGDWADFRHRMVDREDSLCHVGHQDVLALQ
ncbi:class I SAM-dependent methyltransferase [Neorhizobium sp. DT-125]|uniref:class I SAM-dependent methyltransferase n=1 Tax=Neorhizobium sp. DT-125 TaxID=3396163 RepID=UPI003F1C718C